MNLRRPAAALFAAALMLAGCSLDLEPSDVDVPENLKVFYNQEVSWTECPDQPDYECAKVKVPLDYKKPHDDKIRIAMMKVPAKSGKPKGTLFANPGGPGGSGIEMAASADQHFSEKLRENYDIVGFDPRGVGESTAVDCLSDGELGKVLDSDFDLTSAEGRAAEKAQTQKVVEGCKRKSGELLRYVGTESAARDLDVLRGLVRDEKLNYLGFSYGTSLGGMYADLFPNKVGRMVLDGAVDSQLGSPRMAYEQVRAFETAFDHYAKHCVKQASCALGKTVAEAKAKARSLVDQAHASPFPTSNPSRPLTGTMLRMTMISFMYNDSHWKYLDQAFDQLVGQNNGSYFLAYFDLFQEREGDRFKNNSNEANWAINCADYKVSPKSEYEKYAEKLRREAPVFGAANEEGSDMCATWPYHAKANPGPYRAKGSAPIVVIGTKYDPATPISWARTLHKRLENSVLLTWEGDGHTAYSRAGSCLREPVDRYFLTGKVPKDGLVCPASSKSVG